MVLKIEVRMNKTEPYAQWLIDNPPSLEDVCEDSWHEIDELVKAARAEEISDKRFNAKMASIKTWISDQPRRPVLRKTQPEDVKKVVHENATLHSKEKIGPLALKRMRHSTRTTKTTTGQTFRVNAATAKKIVYNARKSVLDKAYREGSWNGKKSTITASVDNALELFKGDI
jgi:hypothetical protein